MKYVYLVKIPICGDDNTVVECLLNKILTVFFSVVDTEYQGTED